MIHLHKNVHLLEVYNLILLKAHMCRESISTTNTTCNFFLEHEQILLELLPSEKVLQSHKIPKAPPAQPISLFPVPQTLNFHIQRYLQDPQANALITRFQHRLALAEASRRIPSSRPGTFSKSPVLFSHPS